jgi:hypothetical protein
LRRIATDLFVLSIRHLLDAENEMGSSLVSDDMGAARYLKLAAFTAETSDVIEIHLTVFRMDK